MKKTPLIVLTMTLGLLCSCVTTPKGTRPPESDPISSDGSTRVEYPAVIRGAWRLGPEPCHLPVNPDADGRLEISAAEMIGYETTYKPVRIESANKTANTWVALELELQRTNSEVLALSRSRYSTYIEDDRAYLDDLATYLRDSDRTWRAYRDANCLFEPFAQGMSRHESYDLTQSCRADKTRQRISELKRFISSMKFGNAKSPSHTTLMKGTGVAAMAEYPLALRGLWIPKGMQCPNPIDQDSEYLLSISADMLGQYENTSKPLHVENALEQSTKWRILSTFSPGTGHYSGEEIVTFALNGDTLSIESGNAITNYSKCY
jgi:uncharacterized protein YecT (DUF1311 family)